MLTTFSLELSSDIKPENLLISSDDILKLCDFGKSFCHIILKKHLSLITDTLFQGSGGGSIIFTLINCDISVPCLWFHFGKFNFSC